MPINKKQLLRMIRFVALLKANKYPNCTSFCKMLKDADIYENINIACTPKTIYRDIKSLKEDFNAPIKFDASANGYCLSDYSWTFLNTEWETFVKISEKHDKSSNYFSSSFLSQQ